MRALGEHVHLVDDVHLVLADDRGKIDFIRQLANLVDGVVGCRVDFQDVEIARKRELHAHLALAAGRTVLGVQAVDRAGKNLGDRSLASAARSRER